MRKLFLSILAASILSAGALAAQEGKREKGSKPKDGLTKELNLSSAQQESLKSLNKEFKEKSETLRKQQRELAKNHRESFNNILTPEQQSKLKEFRGNKEKIRSKADRNKQKGKFAHKGNKGKKNHFKLDENSRNELKALKDSFQKQKDSILDSRIAPEEQTKQIKAAKQKFREDRHEIIKKGRSVKQKESKES